MNKTEQISTINNYFEFYNNIIRPGICEIDIALKCNSRFNNANIAKLLNITEHEVEHIRSIHNIHKLNKISFIKIMENGSSELCKMFRREAEVGSPYIYKREDLAYIYNLNIDMVNKVCDGLSIAEITWQTMPGIFKRIPYEYAG